MFKKHLNRAKLQAHIAQLRPRIQFWTFVGSQSVQDIYQRVEKAYQLFFKHHKTVVRTPNFKKVRTYKSFTLKQAGYKFLGGNLVKIGSKVYYYIAIRTIEMIQKNPLNLISKQSLSTPLPLF